MLVGLFLALGAVFVVTGFAIAGINASGSNGTIARQSAFASVDAAHTTLAHQLKSFETKTQACRSDPHPLACVTEQDQRASQAFGQFAAALQAMQFPPVGDADARRLYTESVLAQQIFSKLAQVSSGAEYQQTIASSGMRSVLNKFDQDYRNLAHDLGF